MNLPKYTGANDPLLDFPDSSFDFRKSNGLRLNRIMELTIENSSDADKRVVIFGNHKSDPLLVIKDGVIAFAAGATTLKGHGVTYPIADFLFDLKENPTQFLSCQVSSDNVAQLKKSFEISTFDLYDQRPIERVSLDRPELAKQFDNKRISVDFEGLFSTAVTELALVIPATAGVTTTTTLKFNLGVRLAKEYILQERLRAANNTFSGR